MIFDINVIKREDSNFNWICCKELNFMMQLLNIKQYFILMSLLVILLFNLFFDVINMGLCVIVVGCLMRFFIFFNEIVS